MKKKFGNPLGLLAVAVNYLRKSRKSSAEGGQANDVKLEVFEDQSVTAKYVDEVRQAVLPPEPLVPRIGWDQIKFPPRKGEK